MRLLDRLRPGSSTPAEQRFSFNDLANYFSFDGSKYALGGLTQTLQGDKEQIGPGFARVAGSGYLGNGVVFAVSMARIALFAEARFQFQRLEQGRPTDLFGLPSLSLLERPDWNMSTGELLARMDQDVTIAGNWFATAVPGGPTGRRIRRLQPDWVTIVMGSQSEPDDPAWAVDAEVAGYIYTPGGPGSGKRATYFAREQVAHYSPYPDPLAQWRGMSWMTPILREIEGDSAATQHKLKFFEHGATPNMVILPNPALTQAQFEEAVRSFRTEHEGVANAYKTLFFGGGADVKVVGADLKQLDFKLTQGAGETRVAAAGQVPPVIVGLSEGLQAATYSNYGQARRKFGDHFARPHWRMASQALETLVPPPSGSRLWTDDRHIAFLRDDEADLADIRNKDAQTLRALLDAGYKPDPAIEYVQTGDLRKLTGQHTGFFSVQLNPPGGPNGRSAEEQQARDLVEMVQKVYLGVGVVLTPDEAREILNQGGADLPAGFEPSARLPSIGAGPQSASPPPTEAPASPPAN